MYQVQRFEDERRSSGKIAVSEEAKENVCIYRHICFPASPLFSIQPCLLNFFNHFILSLKFFSFIIWYWPFFLTFHWQHVCCWKRLIYFSPTLMISANCYHYASPFSVTDSFRFSSSSFSIVSCMFFSHLILSSVHRVGFFYHLCFFLCYHFHYSYN